MADPSQERPRKRSRDEDLRILYESVENVLQTPGNDGTAYGNMGIKLLEVANAFIRRGNRSADSTMFNHLDVSSTAIGQGNDGTIVFEGFFDGQPVAVKRLVVCIADIDQVMLRSIQHKLHPNVVNFYGVISNQYFTYLALERCTCSCYDLIQAYSKFHVLPGEPSTVKYEKHLGEIRDMMQKNQHYLWTRDGRPLPLLQKLMRDVLLGLMQLHTSTITHGALKPQNVMITGEVKLCAKLSDLGIRKRLREDKSSNPGTRWQAPEQLRGERQEWAVDMFSCGCVLFYFVTGGSHPFGELLECDINIKKNNPVNLALVKSLPEAYDLIQRLLQPNARLRPRASMVINHPFFWSAKKRLQFISQFSDALERQHAENCNSNLLMELQSKHSLIFTGTWASKINDDFMDHISSTTTNSHDVRDLLRFIRNKWSDRKRLPKRIEVFLCKPFHKDLSFSECYVCYFARLFPRLLMESYWVASQFCRGEGWFKELVRDEV